MTAQDEMTEKAVQMSQQISVLVLDDEGAVLASLNSLLRREGHALHLFHSGLQALEFLKKHRVDIILSDMRMPEISGSEFLEKATKACPDTIRIMMSGYEDKEVILDSLACGLGQYYIFKPWNDGQLRTTLKEAVNHRRMLRELHLKELMNTFATLPSPPRINDALLAMVTKPDISVVDLVIEIERSPALLAKLLRVANSVYFGTRQSVTSVNDAVRLVGTEYVVSLAVSINAFWSLQKYVDSNIESAIEQIWQHSIRRANLAKSIAMLWPNFSENNSLSITTLLQDIGYVIRMCIAPDQYRACLRMAEEENITLYEAEQRVFTVAHDAVGEAVLRFWNFPPTISSAVGAHHGPVNEDALLTILQIADVLESNTLATPHDPQIDNQIFEWKKKLLG